MRSSSPATMSRLAKNTILNGGTRGFKETGFYRIGFQINYLGYPDTLTIWGRRLASRLEWFRSRPYDPSCSFVESKLKH